MRYIVLYILLFAFWLLLTVQWTVENIVAGGVAALITTPFFGKYFIKDVSRFFQPHRYFWLVVYFFVFLWACILANFDVAYRVLHPAMPIKPGIVKVKMTLKTGFARMMLANSITMTPGTISVDIVDDNLFVHWIYVSSTEPEVYTNIIAGKFEKYLKLIFE
jgi:multicomponent Na+:H+ antiporter subunit E